MINDPLSSRRTFFVLGVQGSGTTWTGSLVDANPRAVCLNEPSTFHTLILPILQFQNVRNKKLEETGRSEFSIHQQTVADLSRTLFAGLFRHYDLTDVELLGEKTPENAVGLQHIDRIFPGSQYIWVHRDLRDSLMSRYTVAAKQNPNLPFLEYAEVYSSKFALPLIDGFKYLMRRRPRQTLAVRYEDILADPVSKLREIYRFLNLPHEDDVLLAALKTTGTASEDATSVADVPVQDPASRGKIGMWRRHDSPAFQELYARTMRPLNLDAGYPE